MSPDGSETKLKKEMAKHPLTLMIKIEIGVQTRIEEIHCAIPKRMRLPIPPPIATKKYLLMRATPVCAAAALRGVISPEYSQAVSPSRGGKLHCRELPMPIADERQPKFVVAEFFFLLPQPALRPLWFNQESE